MRAQEADAESIAIVRRFVPTRDYALQQKRWRGHFRLLAKLM
jgi:hypothetical protein